MLEKHSLSLSKPVPNTRHDGGPASRLHQPVEDLARDGAASHGARGKHRLAPRCAAPTLFRVPGSKLATLIPKLPRKHSVCCLAFFFSPAGAFPEPFALFPLLNWERLVLPNRLPALLGETGAPGGFGTHATRARVLRAVEMPNVVPLGNWATLIPESH